MGKKNFKKKPGASLDERRKKIHEARKELKKSSTVKKSSQYSIDQLLDKADEYIDRFEYELAQKFCQRTLEIEPDNIRALETTGSLLLELGNSEAAKQCFGRAVEVNPDTGHAKYMYLGQLFDGAQAIQCFQKGIELMVKEREAQSAQELAAACGGSEENVTVRDISSAYCSVAEIYMTDCCEEVDAESHCEEAINKALEIDKDNPEAYQLKASFYLSKNSKEGARDMINKSVSLWLPKYEEIDKGENVEECDPIEATKMTFDSRLSTAKILTEVEEYETAVTVLEGLLDENEDEPQVWYMIGWANYLQGEDYRENARFYLHKCKEVFSKTKCEDEDLLKHVEELLTEIGPGEGDMNEEEDGSELEIDSNSDNENEMEH